MSASGSRVCLDCDVMVALVHRIVYYNFTNVRTWNVLARVTFEIKIVNYVYCFVIFARILIRFGLVFVN